MINLFPACTRMQRKYELRTPAPQHVRTMYFTAKPCICMTRFTAKPCICMNLLEDPPIKQHLIKQERYTLVNMPNTSCNHSGYIQRVKILTPKQSPPKVVASCADRCPAARSQIQTQTALRINTRDHTSKCPSVFANALTHLEDNMPKRNNT